MAHYREKGRLHFADTRVAAVDVAARRYDELARELGHRQVALITDASNAEVDALNLRVQALRAKRGEIVDRRGVKLASSVDVDSVWVDPSMLPDVRDAAKKLAKALGLDARELQERMENARRFAWVKRQVSDGEAQKVRALNLPGIGYAKEPRRFYPQREVAAHVVGFVGTDSHGLDGLEQKFEADLSGERIRREGFRDAKGRKLLTNGLENPEAREGASLTLTIDSTVQYITERALQKAVTEQKAAAGMAVVLDPKTGEVLAVANWPRFNPNAPRDAQAEALHRGAAATVREVDDRCGEEVAGEAEAGEARVALVDDGTERDEAERDEVGRDDVALVVDRDRLERRGRRQRRVRLRHAGVPRHGLAGRLGGGDRGRGEEGNGDHGDAHAGANSSRCAHGSP